MEQLQEHLRKLLEEVKVDGELPREVHVSRNQHPDIGAMVRVHGPRKFLIMHVHSVPFFFDPGLRKGNVKVCKGATEKVVKLKK